MIYRSQPSLSPPHTHTVPVFGYQVGLCVVLAVLTFPISFLKNVVSVIQLVVAVKNIVALDVIERARRREQSRDQL